MFSGGGLDNQSDSFKEITEAQLERRRVQDIDDLHNEMAGVDVGRIGRFLSPEARALLQEKRNGKSSSSLSALDMMLLNNPAYADIYNNAMDRLADYEAATERALSKEITKLEAAEKSLNEILDQAATLPDGTRVFRDANGSVWTEADQKIDANIADQIEWQGSEPSRELYKQHLDTKRNANDSVHEIRVFQTEVGAVRERFTDPDNPPSPEDIQNAFKALEERAPDLIRPELPKKVEMPSMNVEQSLDVTVPNL